MNLALCEPLPADANAILDLRGTPCPLNFIRAKLRLEQLPLEQRLELWLDAGEPIEQVPRSLELEGYAVEICETPHPHFVVWVNRPVSP